MKHCDAFDGDSSAHVEPVTRKGRSGIFGGLALTLVALAYVSAPYVDFTAINREAMPPGRSVEVTQSVRSEAVHLDGALLDPSRPVGFAPRIFSQSAPLRSELQLAGRATAPTQNAAAQPPATIRTVQSVPLPMPRPADLGSQSPPLIRSKAPPPFDPFEKLFGKRQQPGTALAYASADSGVRGDGASTNLLPQNDGLTAIYDITARTVYLPDGTKLEAHSGLRDKMDDPRYVHVKMHGATPPHLYDLTPREALFHGVEALRMHPVGGAEAIFGRTGLLTHSYLLGPTGDSNGCVSFKDYDAFLRAYKDGKVKRLIVVASVDDPQLDLRVAERRTPKQARTYALSSFGAAASLPPDDRYVSAFTSSLASRTSSSARSLN